MEFPKLRNDLILRAARGEDVERVPVWAMRQAGRYLPEFRKVREDHDFFKICRTPELACEITLQPILRFDLDAAIIFSDILVIPQALGLVVEMVPGKGPHFPQPIREPQDLERVATTVDIQMELGYVMDAVALTRVRLDGKVPLVGFCGAPWTLMSYMIEGGGSPSFPHAKRWLYTYPDESTKLLGIITEVCVNYLVAKVKSGAQMLQVFESHAGILTISQFRQFALPFISAIARRVKEALGDEAVPMTYFSRGGHHAIGTIAESGYDVISVDWTIEPEEARKLVGPNVTLQGNLDPCALFFRRGEVSVAYA
eukprot:scpid59736/ scgid33610/ Uroporphyrinogen decarboxylase